MKKIYFLTLPFLAAALWSCTDKNDLRGDNNPDRDIAANYLSVSIVPAMETGTRVDGETGDNGGKYKDGNAIENYVKNVRFYFFDAAGNAQAVKRNDEGSWDSYYEVALPQLNDPETEDKPNVEKVINATIVLETPNGDLFPASLVAIVNYDKALFGGKDIDASSINKLLEQTGQFAKSSYGEEEGILMSNSVYKEANGASQIVERKLAPENFGSSESEAQKNPVTIYVERAVAKVSLSTDKIENTISSSKFVGRKIFKLSSTTKEGDDSDLKISDGKTEKEVYVGFLGWNVTQTADKSFAVKNLRSDWTGDSPFVGWTYPAYFRSFWALNPAPLSYNYTTFNRASEGLPLASAIKGISDNDTSTPNYTYAPENAPQNQGDKRTEVIVAAQLVDRDGSAIKLADFGGMKFMGENYEDELLQYVANILGVWKKTSEAGGYKYETIQKDLKLVSAQKAGKTGPGLYYTYVQFEDGSSENLYVDNNDETGKEVKFAELKEKLSNLPFIKVWTNGYTYYFVDIEHLNTVAGAEGQYPVGKYGVVRNHWYAIDVTKIYGLGTPVFDPSEEIIPENPQDHETYLAAKINILSWRLVNQNTTLGQK